MAERAASKALAPEISVVIPTHDRAQILARALRCLDEAGRVFGHPYEVVVVDDGSGDGTPELLAGASPIGPPGTLRSFRQPPSGPAVARNRGVREARGELILFLGDDILASPGLLQAHAAAHEARRGGGPVAVLGRAPWAAEMRPGPFHRFLMEGDQFGFLHIEDREDVPYNFFYTANISLPRRVILDAGLFDEGFPNAAWEDVELSFRMTRAGLRIVYEPEAVAEHLHPTTLDSFCRRREKVGVDAVRLYRKHPETEKMICFDWLPPAPARWKVRAAELFRRSYSLLERWRLDRGPLWPWRRIFRRLSYYHYFDGVRRGLALEQAAGAGRGGGVRGASRRRPSPEGAGSGARQPAGAAKKRGAR